MKQKIIAEYDTLTGDITDKSGTTWYVGLGAKFDSYDGQGTSVDDLCKLKDAGFTAEEIIEMKKREVL